jgi:hypothetical protein
MISSSGTNAASFQPVAVYSLNVLLNTILFLVVFMTATAWTSASVNAVQKVPGNWKLFVFASVLTVVTLGLAIGFGEISRRKQGINVNYASTISSALAVSPVQRKQVPSTSESARSITMPLSHLYAAPAHSVGNSSLPPPVISTSAWPQEGHHTAAKAYASRRSHNYSHTIDTDDVLIELQ